MIEDDSHSKLIGDPITVCVRKLWKVRDVTDFSSKVAAGPRDTGTGCSCRYVS